MCGIVDSIGDAFDSIGDALAGFDDAINDFTWRNAAKQRKAAKRQYELQRQGQFAQANMTKYNNRMARLQQIREARLKRAQAISAAALSGGGLESSNINGVLNSANSQLAGQMAHSQTTEQFGNYMSGLNQEVASQQYIFNKASASQQELANAINLGMQAGKLFLL